MKIEHLFEKGVERCYNMYNLVNNKEGELYER